MRKNALLGAVDRGRLTIRLLLPLAITVIDGSLWMRFVRRRVVS
jgi:hypothetical protein